MTVITMSRNELTRLRVLIDVGDGRLSVEDATGLIGVGRRQIYRLLGAFRARGPEGLISRKRGRPSNRALGAVFRETVLAIVRERYADFGPTPAFARAGSWRPRSCPRFTAWVSASRRCGNG
jgi:transposase